MIETMRCFVALDLAGEVVDSLRAAQGELRQALGGDPRVKWVSPAAMHLTLKFIGDRVDLGVTPAVTEALQKATRRVPAFHLQVRGVGAFPKPDAARVLWAGLRAPGDLDELWGCIEDRLEDVGFKRQARGLSPHVTLGRVRDHKATPDLSTTLQPLADRDFGPSPVHSVVLYRSTLTQQGPR